MSDSHKSDLVRRMKRIEGQARGIQRMLEADRECSDILAQLSAMNEAIRSASLLLCEDYALECFDAGANKGRSRERVTAMIDALMRAPR